MLMCFNEVSRITSQRAHYSPSGWGILGRSMFVISLLSVRYYQSKSSL